MQRSERRAAVAAYKERKPAWGVYAVICNATGEAWVGRSLHLDTQKNGLWFSLRMGSSPHATLQAAWNRYGEAEFRFEALEQLREDFPAVSRDRELKARVGLWRARLEAQAL